MHQGICIYAAHLDAKVFRIRIIQLCLVMLCNTHCDTDHSQCQIPHVLWFLTWYQLLGINEAAKDCSSSALLCHLKFKESKSKQVDFQTGFSQWRKVGTN